MKIWILATKDRKEITDKTYAYWQSLGWLPQIEYNDGYFPSYGRNRILQRFYASKDPWLAMCDNDTILDLRRGQSSTFVKDPMAILSCIPQTIATIHPMNNLLLRVGITHKQPAYQNNWVLERDIYVSGKILFHRNHLKREYYQRTDLPALEDAEWAFQQVKDGYSCNRLNNIVLQEHTSKSSLFKDQTKRLEAYDQAKKHLITLYPQLYINDRGHFVRKEFIKTYLKDMDRMSYIPYDNIKE